MTRYLLDTNIISNATKPTRPDRRVDTAAAMMLFVSHFKRLASITTL